MKSKAPFLLVLAVLAGSPVLRAQESKKTIDLNKPVNESIKPNGFYWSFDDGLIGETEPSIVLDLSENGFDGQISKGAAATVPTYTEGVFGTGIYVQGFPNIMWKNGGNLGAAADPAKLLMKGEAFTGGIWFKMDDRKPDAHILIRRDDNAIGWRLMVVREDAGDKDSEGSSWFLNLQYGDSRDRSRSLASTSAFADGNWHHVGFSVSPGPDSGGFTVVYWLDGEIVDTVSFLATVPEPNPEQRFLTVGTGTWGLLDDAFVTTGIYNFKK